MRKVFTLCMVLSFCGCQVPHESSKSEVSSVGNYGQHLVAFSKLTDGYWQIWISQLNGQNAKQLTFSNSDKRKPVWGPDDNIYFQNNIRQLFKIDINQNASEERAYGHFGNVEDLVFSTDGSKIVFVHFRNEFRDSANIWIANADGTEYRVLTHQRSMQYNPSLSPDGTKLAYIASNGHHHTDELHILDITTGEDIALTKNNYQEIVPKFSPDGKKIVYSSDFSGNYEIWSMNSDGTEKSQLTRMIGIDTHPVFSPDGKKILFSSHHNGQLQLAIMNSDGSELQQLSIESPCIDPAWKEPSL